MKVESTICALPITVYTALRLSCINVLFLLYVIKLIVLLRLVLTKAPPHLNVITHFLAQCGSEPWTTMTTASAPTCTPL